MRPYLKSIYVYNSYKNKHFLIDFSPDKNRKFKHLILTGKNGSGKSTVLKAINKEFVNIQFKEIKPQKYFPFQSKSPSARAIKGFVSKYNYDVPKAELDFTDEYSEVTQKRNFPLIYIPTLKYKNFAAVREKNSFHLKQMLEAEKYKISDTEGDSDFYISLASYFHNFLLSLKKEQAYAIADDEKEIADGLTKRFKNLEKTFKILFEEPELKLKHTLRKKLFYFVLPDGRKINFNQLSHGHNAVQTMIAEIMLNIESYREKYPKDVNPRGVVVIDEIESHLHISLQEKILPILTQMFPDLQFIVATHSPAVIASLENCTIYDLSKNEALNENITGIPYNVLMKSHFNIESEYSISVTNKLKRAQKLIRVKKLSIKENVELKNLTKELNELSPDLAMDIFIEQERKKTNDKL